MADCNAIQKATPFCKITPANVRLSHSSWQTNPSSVPHHHKANRRWDHMLEGSAHLTMGDVSGDIKPMTSSLQSQSTLIEREHLHPCPRSQATWRTRVWPAKLTEKWDNTVQWTFVVPGAQNFIRMLKASNFAQSAWHTELYLSALGTLGMKCHLN